MSNGRTHGRLDCAVNNAALPPDDDPLDGLDEDRFDAIIAVNLRGVALCLKHEIRTGPPQNNTMKPRRNTTMKECSVETA